MQYNIYSFIGITNVLVKKYGVSYQISKSHPIIGGKGLIHLIIWRMSLNYLIFILRLRLIISFINLISERMLLVGK